MQVLGRAGVSWLNGVMVGAGGKGECSKPELPSPSYMVSFSGLSTSNHSNSFLPSPRFLPQKERIREKFVAALQREFAGKGLRFSRGEQRGLTWLCPGLFIVFPMKYWEGEQESWLFPPGAWRPW